jgi:hypothetical protein
MKPLLMLSEYRGIIINKKNHLGWGLYWMRLGILELSGERVDINFSLRLFKIKVSLKVRI